MAPKGKCTFQSDGLFQIEFKSWVKKVTNNVFNARCTLCNIEFNLSSMGRQSFVSHANGKKHLQKLNQANESTPINKFMILKANTTSNEKVFSKPTIQNAPEIDSVLTSQRTFCSTSTQTDMSKSISGSRDIKKHFN